MGLRIRAIAGATERSQTDAAPLAAHAGSRARSPTSSTHLSVFLPMALQSITRPANGNTRLSSPPPSVQAGSYVSRISPADELQLACRLAECRRELAAVALLDADMAVELQRIATELA